MPARPAAAVAAVIAVLLVAGSVGIARHQPGRAAPGGAPPTSTRPPPPSPGVPPADALEAVVPALEAFVERERGLRYERKVQVTLLDDAAFRRRFVASDDDDRKELVKAQDVLRAMGLLAPDADLVKAVESFAGSAVVGFYDPETKELVARGGAPTPFVRETLVHELTHALEDQHFGLDRKKLGDEAALGFRALAEGSALRIEDRYLRSLGGAERDEAERARVAQGLQVPPDLPEVVQEAFGFPYAFGPALVEAVVRAGGQPRLDAAFADPPASTEQVLDPRRFLRRDQPEPVPTPRADGAAFDDGEVGQLFLILMLEAELDREVAARAAVGWGGDHYVAWKQGGGTCLRVDFVMDTPGDAAELVAALQEWAGRRPRASASASAPSLTTCS